MTNGLIEEKRTLAARAKASVRRNLIAGLLLIAPIGATVFFLRFLINWVDRTLLLIPQPYRPENYLPFPIPGLGLILVFLILFLTGFVARNILGKKLVEFWEMVLSRIPLVSTVYRSVKQLMETVLSGTGREFKGVVLIEYPRKGVYALGYITGTTVGEIQQKTEHKVLNLFLPTTPNPTSGFYLMVPEDEVIPLEMSVEDSFKVLMSGGIINPEDERAKARWKPRPKRGCGKPPETPGAAGPAPDEASKGEDA